MYTYKGESMALGIGKPTVVKTAEQAQTIHRSVAQGKSLDTSKFNYTPKKSVSDVLSGK